MKKFSLKQTRRKILLQIKCPCFSPSCSPSYLLNCVLCAPIHASNIYVLKSCYFFNSQNSFLPSIPFMMKALGYNTCRTRPSTYPLPFTRCQQPEARKDFSCQKNGGSQLIKGKTGRLCPCFCLSPDAFKFTRFISSLTGLLMGWAHHSCG